MNRVLSILVTTVALIWCTTLLSGHVLSAESCRTDAECAKCYFCSSGMKCVRDNHCVSGNLTATQAQQSKNDADTCNDVCHYACSNAYNCGTGKDCTPPDVPSQPPESPPQPPPSQNIPPPPQPTSPPPSPRPTSTPRPTNTPIPTSTATPTQTPTPTITPSPTPRLPTRIITQSFSKPDSQVVGFSVQSDLPEAIQQVCLQAQDCSLPESSCSVQTEHRVKLSQKVGYSGKPDATMYIIECLLDNGEKICTTGSATTDNLLYGEHGAGTSNREYMQQKYGYRFVSFQKVTSSGVVPASNPITTDSTGAIGTYEWESRTTKQVERLFFAVNDITNTLTSKGSHTTQKQATFTTNSTIQNCIVIAWDPHGVIYDSSSRQPLEGARVSLYAIRNGEKALVSASEGIGTFRNPYTTGSDGRYSFRVVDGTYIVKVEKDGYVYDGYTEESFEERGKEVVLNVPLKKVTINPIQVVFKQLQSFFKL